MIDPYAPVPVETPAHGEEPDGPLSALAVVAFVLSFVLTVAGMVLGIVALAQLRRTRARGTVLAVAAIALGAFLTLFWIVALLAAIAIPVAFGTQSAAKDAATESDLAHAKTAMVSYAAQNNGVYPADIIGLEGMGFTPTGGTSRLRIVGAGAGGTFCIEGTSETGDVFHVTQSTGVQGGDCPG